MPAMPWPQLLPITSAPAAVSCSAACSGVAPIIVRSFFAPESNVMQATTGRPVSRGGGHGQSGLGQVGHGFDHDAVGAGLGHGLGLFGEGGLHVGFAHLAHHQHDAAGADRGEDHRPAGCRPAGNLDAGPVDFGHLIGQAVPGEDEAIGPEGVGENHPASGLDVRPGDLLRPVRAG